jgi:hypothetical protein
VEESVFQPTDQLTIRLTVTEWNLIMGMLGEQKYVAVANIINKINEQATAQHPTLHPPADGELRFGSNPGEQE